MRALVTGGAGYIGAHICQALAEDGHQPIVLDSLENGHREHVKWGPIEVGNVNCPMTMEHCVKKHEPNVIIHMAAKALVGESMTDPWSYYAENLTGMLSVLRVAGAVESIVLASSCAARKPVTSPYGNSKLICEGMLKEIAEFEGIGAVALRLFNVIGCSGDGIGEIHDPETHLMPNLCRAAITGEPLTINGGGKHPQAVRDYVDVRDVAQAFVVAAKHSRNGMRATLDVGSGNPMTADQVIERFSEATGLDAPFKRGPYRDGDATHAVANLTPIEYALAWRPSIPFADSARAALEWERRLLQWRK